MRSLVLLLTVLALAAFAGCGSSPSHGFSDDASGDGGGPSSSLDGGTSPADQPVSSHAVFGCEGCPPFPPMNAPACAASVLGPSRVAYPPDHVLLPPNLHALEVHFPDIAPATLYEIDFVNGTTEVRVETRCERLSNGRSGGATGCTPTLPLLAFRDVAETNREGEVTVTVRATADGSCVSTSPPITVRFANEDVTGGIFYWQSTVYGGKAGATGGIYSHDFGTLDVAPTPFYTSGATGTCVGCHSLSRDGERITVGIDDPDSDDGFDDVSTIVLDTKTRTVLGKDIPPGFQTWAHDHSRLVTSSYQDFNPLPFGTASDEHLEVYDGQGATHLVSLALGPSGFKGTQPDLSADDRSLVFVAPKTGTIDPTIGDHHFKGSSLWGATFDPTSNTMGAPRVLIAPTGEGAYYYPSFSPDGRFLVMNSTTGGDIFYNKNARVVLLPSAGGAAIDLPALNAGTGLTNSWPRWSPYVQTYKGHKMVWVTFSSSRDYGLRLKNEGAPHCYPAESLPEDQPQMDAQITSLDGCEQPQIWMAAVDIDDAASGDRSYPAFWMPFQDIGSHNHSAQWVQKVIAAPATCGSTTCGPDQLCCAPNSCQPTCVK